MTDEQDEDPPSRASYELIATKNDKNGAGLDTPAQKEKAGIAAWLRGLFKSRQNEPSLRDALEDYIVEAGNGHHAEETVSRHERTLIANVLKFRDLSVVDVMIPRADIIAIDIATEESDLLNLLSEKQYSRFPVYREALDNVVGTIHIKDIIAALARGKEVVIDNLVREVPIVSPSMPVLDLVLMMQQLRKHMALVVDEYGGIDGLVTIGDVIEAIIGEVEDEYDTEDEIEIHQNDDGSIVVDARMDIEEFEKEFGRILTDEEREDSDTLGGLIFEIAGRVPARGEVLAHDSGMVFEIVDADPRRVNKVLIKNTPLS